MERTITININECQELEKAWYEYNSTASAITFLSQSDNINEVALQDYNDLLDRRFMVLEKLKKALGKKYIPEDMDINKCSYSFDFEKNTVTYTKVM